MRASNPCSAKTVLGWGLGTFVLLQLGLAVAIETCWPILRDPDYIQKVTRLRQRLADPSRPTAAVMLGSSRTIYGLDGHRIERDLARSWGRPVVVHNFGQWGAGPASNLMYLRRLLADGVHPDLVLVEVLPTFLAADSRTDRNRLSADRLSLADLAVLKGCGFPVASRQREWWSSWAIPCSAHRRAILNALAPTFVPPHLRSQWSSNPDPSCFIPQMPWAAEPCRRQAAFRKAWREHFGILQHFRAGASATTALRQTLAACQNARIRAALVLMPEGSGFRGWYSTAALRQLYPLLQSLSHEFDAPLIDARAWVADAGFSDSHHLLPGGAATFSRRLGREAILPLLQGQPLARTTGHAP